MRFPLVFRLALAGVCLAFGGATAPAQEAQWRAYTDTGWRMSRGGELTSAREFLLKGLKHAEEFPADDPRRALTLAYLANVSHRKGQAYDAGRYAKQALAIYDALPADGTVAGMGQGLNALALVSQASKDYATADRLYQKATASEEKARGPASASVAQFLANRATLLEAEGRYEEAEALHKRQLGILDGLDDPALAAQVAAANLQLGRLYRLWDKEARAEPYLVRAVELHRRLPKKNDAELAGLLSELGGLYFELGKYDRAGPPLKEAVKLRDFLGKSPPEKQSALAESYHNLGAYYLAQKNYEPAEAAFNKALALRDALAPGGDLRTAATLNALGTLHVAQKRYPQAVAALKRALQIKEKSLGEGHGDVAPAAEALAVVTARTGNAKEAERYFQRALAIREQTLGTGHRTTAATLHNLANFYRDQKRYPEAEALYQRALAAKEKSLGAEHPSLVPVLDNYVLLLRQTKRTDEAAKQAKRASALRAKAPATASYKK